ncbi:MAG TPA: hypothetical protein VFD70_01545 [Anaerolineae bacterium]|nr:hypothetical protein [Anaerolineae bacterium]
MYLTRQAGAQILAIAPQPNDLRQNAFPDERFEILILDQIYLDAERVLQRVPQIKPITKRILMRLGFVDILP